MARPRGFDREEALRTAVLVFWRQGYAATTATDLIRAMGIGRQSFYDTFGGRRQCYLEALRAYAREEVSSQLGAVGAGAPPLEALRAFLHIVAERPDEKRLLGCMVVNALAEGPEDPDVTEALGPSGARLREGVTDLLRRARERGEIPASLDVDAGAHAILFTRMGLMLGARAGQAPSVLRSAADFAVDQLRRPQSAS